MMNCLESPRKLMHDVKLEQLQLAEAETPPVERAPTLFLRELAIHFQLLGSKLLAADLVP